MPDYQNGKIYKIIDLESNECYIGSTTLALSQRLAQHVRDYKYYLNKKKKSITSFKIIEKNDYVIILVEKYPCDSKEELHARESHYSQTILCVNKVNNQGLFNALGKTQYQKLFKQKYVEQHKAKIKEQCKQYREKNRMPINEINKLHFEKNKEGFTNFRKSPLLFECGSCISRSNKASHKRSLKHQEYEQNRLYYKIKIGLDMIKIFDKHFIK
jgi:hypothetical protein